MAIKKQGKEKRMEELIHFFTKGEVVSTVLAVVIVILTSIIKIPIKKLAQKRALPAKVTRFIPLIPIILGGVLSALVTWVKSGTLGDEFYELWLCATGSSIALYSIYANFRDSGNVDFIDLLKQGIYTLLCNKLSGGKQAELKTLAETIADRLTLSKSGASGDFYAEMQELLKDYLDSEEIGEVSKQVESIWTELHGDTQHNEEVEKIACTATEKYEYEIRKSRTATQTFTKEQREEKQDET